jgi:serpin B
MMRQTGLFGYAQDGGVQILELRYAGGDLSMIVLLPAASSSVEELREALPRKLDGWLAAISPEQVNVYLPRFKLEQRFLLNEPLIALGMADAFSDTAADFSGMRADGGKDLYISKVIHKAFVDVNEVGTEAAAATAVVMETKSVQMTSVFKADRPFLFLIRDVRTGTVLFMGRLSDPR